MPKKKVLITVKTYPTISTKYDELVCTGGFDEDGNWIRIYPIPFRRLEYEYMYKKYQWVEIDLVRNTRDFRPESYRPANIDSEDFISLLSKLDTKGNWYKRKEIVLKNVYTNMTQLINEARDKNKYTSLAVFKPTKIIDFVYESCSREWSKEKLAALQQQKIFEKNRNNVVSKLPYKFSYIFEDDSGKRSKLMNEDWELGALYWNCLKKHEGDEELACKDVKKKYLNDFAKTKDLYLYIGTTLKHHNIGKNPFIIIGTFTPKKEHPKLLF